MADLWESIKKNISQGIRTVSAKTEELTQIGRLKIEIIAVKRDIEKSFIELGGRIYHQLDGDDSYDVREDGNITNLMKNIKELEKRMKKLEKDIAKAQSEGKIKLERDKKK
jgi:hypothetical protein